MLTRARCVFDASAAVASVLPEQGSIHVRRVLRDRDEDLLVPSNWRLEVGSVLLRAERQGRVTAIRRHAALLRLQALTVLIDAETDSRAWSDTLRIAEQHRLSLYDAAYLELALRTEASLLTLDSRLAAAAQSAGVGTQ